MRLKEKKILKKFVATLKKFSAQGAKKVDYGNIKKKITLNYPIYNHLCSYGILS